MEDLKKKENGEIMNSVMRLYEQHKRLQIEYENHMMVLMEKNSGLKKGRIYTNTSIPHENYNLLVRYELDQFVDKIHKSTFLMWNPTVYSMRSRYFYMVFKKWTKRGDWSMTTIRYDFETAESMMEEPKMLPKQIEKTLNLEEYYRNSF